MRAHELLKSGFQTWVALCNSIHYPLWGYLCFFFKLRIDSEIEEPLRIFFFEIRTCKSRVVAEVRSQTRRRKVKSISRFRRFETRSLKKILRGFSLKTRKVPPERVWD